MGASTVSYLALAGAAVVLAAVVAATGFALLRARAAAARAPHGSGGETDRAGGGALAASLQIALMPSGLPAIDGLRLSASYAPASDAANAGGDFYDAFVLDDGMLAVVIGDAAGGGVPAALAMNVVRQALRNALFDGARPVDALRRANRVLLRSDAPALVSAIAGTIDPATLRFRYACAGHPPPLVAAPDAPYATLPGAGSGIALGIVPHHLASEYVVALLPGALLALYTDGCVEIDRDIIAGTDALGAALAEARTLGIGEPAPAIERAIAGARERADDATILTLTPAATVSEVDLRLPAEPVSIGMARTAMRRFFAGTPLDSMRAYDALVATGEAISNAVEHAYSGRARQTFALRARRDDDDSIWVTVEDYGTWQRQPGLPDRGRGIGIMKELADGCEIERDAEGTRVVLRFAPAALLGEAALM